jgi:hypothetical protein
MKNIFILFNILVILFSCNYYIYAKKIQKNKKVVMANNCIKKIEITNSTNPWRGLTASYKQEEENKHIKTVYIDSKKTIVMENLKQYSYKNESFLTIAENPKKVMVNKKYFSNLEKRDATRIKQNEELLIGKFIDTTFQSISPENLVLFLLESQIITTYWHLESNLCLEKEDFTIDYYTAYFTGIHKYCTNKCEQDALKFSVKINKKSGEMFLYGW